MKIIFNLLNVKHHATYLRNVYIVLLGAVTGAALTSAFIAGILLETGGL